MENLYDYSDADIVDELENRDYHVYFDITDALDDMSMEDILGWLDEKKPNVIMFDKFDFFHYEKMINYLKSEGKLC
jgi:hypothetical protein